MKRGRNREGFIKAISKVLYKSSRAPKFAMNPKDFFNKNHFHEQVNTLYSL